MDEQKEAGPGQDPCRREELPAARHASYCCTLAMSHTMDAVRLAAEANADPHVMEELTRGLVLISRARLMLMHAAPPGQAGRFEERRPQSVRLDDLVSEVRRERAMREEGHGVTVRPGGPPESGRVGGGAAVRHWLPEE